MKVNNVTLGADPEVFLKDVEGKVVPSYRFIKGTKSKPERVSKDIKGLAIQYDNVSAEYCIPACANLEEWLKHHNFMLDYIRETIAEPNGLFVHAVPSVYIEPETTLDEIAMEAGCEPDFDVYYNAPNSKPDITETLLRSGGGHIHIGYENPSIQVNNELIKAMDLFLGVPSVLLDKDIERKQLYGKAGCFRYKKYGVEYRSLSNFWLQDNGLIAWAWQATMEAIDFVNNNGIITNEEQIVEAINKYDRNLAIEILDDYRITIPAYVNHYQD
jgi:hypothetical protein